MGKTATTTEQLQGTVEQLYAVKPNWSAGKLRCSGFTAKFSVKAAVKLRQPLTLRGQWESHPTFGDQFVASEIVYAMPATVESIQAWLMTYAHGIGPAGARRAVEKWGTEFPQVLLNTPAEVAEFLKISLETIEYIAKQWAENSSEVNSIGELIAMGMSTNEAEKTFARYRGLALDNARENVYQFLG